MDAWWVTAIVIGTIGPALAWWTVRPWSRCRPCAGHDTLRDPATGRWREHCALCRGTGQVERLGRVAVRELTGGRIFGAPPEDWPTGQRYGLGGAPFRGRAPGRRAQRGPLPPPRDE